MLRATEEEISRGPSFAIRSSHSGTCACRSVRTFAFHRLGITATAVATLADIWCTQAYRARQWRTRLVTTVLIAARVAQP
jgi:hypothetical protein